MNELMKIKKIGFGLEYVILQDEEEEVSRREEETRRNRVEDLKRLESAKEVEQRMGRLIGKKRKFRREKQKGGGGGGGRKG